MRVEATVHHEDVADEDGQPRGATNNPEPQNAQNDQVETTIETQNHADASEQFVGGW